MTAYGKHIQIAPIPKILEITASSYDFCASIPHYVTIHDYGFLVWVYFRSVGSNKVN